MHQVFCNVSCVLLHSNQPQNIQQANAIMDYSLDAASHAMRVSVNRIFVVSPGALIFYRYMLMDVPFVSNLLLLHNNRQALVDYNLRRENQRRKTFNYQVGQSVFELYPSPNKLITRAHGPYRIE